MRRFVGVWARGRALLMFDFQLFRLLETLIVDQEDQPKELEDNEEFDEQQNLVARLVHRFQNDNVDAHFRVSFCGFLGFPNGKIIWAGYRKSWGSILRAFFF